MVQSAGKGFEHKGESDGRCSSSSPIELTHHASWFRDYVI